MKITTQPADIQPQPARLQRKPRQELKSAPTLKVVPIHAASSRECEKTLEKLLYLAREGQITGLDLTVLTDEREVLTVKAGVLQRSSDLAALVSLSKAVRASLGEEA
ncbi:hypothetical protein [Aromatoleum anaerobium]|uniref:Uncharacterized protein n=1 Tax=Aromatoleum anaerobium TaxID=182180 RepID=A0ABX1PRY6_9RHOO|nr:hypothetical protein [Aromatoleum anaerobium]MCK0507886.1 hypothetical protein [Aromatoleum anaerobium]